MLKFFELTPGQMACRFLANSSPEKRHFDFEDGACKIVRHRLGLHTGPDLNEAIKEFSQGKSSTRSPSFNK